MELIADSAIMTAWKATPQEMRKHHYVYAIKCKVNGKHYIGMTENIKDRLRAHAYSLRGGRHGNEALQADFDKYGDQNFEIRVVAVTKPEKPFALMIEKNWIRKTESYKPEHGYNNDQISKILRGEDPTPWLHVGE